MASSILGFSCVLALFSRLFICCYASSAGNVNLAISTNFMDPGLTLANRIRYTFGGANGSPPKFNLQLAQSRDFKNGTLQDSYDALPTLGTWSASPGHVWAPDVNQRPDGSFVMHYSASNKDKTGIHCIGAATSSNIRHPYVLLNDTIACNLAAGGAIDPDLFRDPQSGTYHLIYKVDGDSIGSGGTCGDNHLPRTSTPIAVQILDTEDPTIPAGDPHYIITNRDPTNPGNDPDGPNVKGPTMFNPNSTAAYYLIDNSGCFANASYTVKHIVCFGAQDMSRCGWLNVENTNALTLPRTGDKREKVYAAGSMDVAVLPDGTTYAVFHGDLNMGWFTNQSKARVRGMYAVELAVLGDQKGKISILEVSSSSAGNRTMPYAPQAFEERWFLAMFLLALLVAVFIK